MKKKKSHKGDRGLRTFFIYAFIVCFIILSSLSIKAIFIIKQSKFDGRNLNLAIAQNNKLVGILGFNASTNSISLLKIKKIDIPIEHIGEKLGIIPDAKLRSDENLLNTDTTALLTKAFFKDSIKTDLTFFDIARLIILSKSVTDKDYRVKEIETSVKVYDNNKAISSLFKNDNIVTDNLSIEIVNATEKSGLGNRLERSLSNIGAQVISVSTAREKKANSTIKYYGDSSYTVTKFKKLLKFPSEKLKEKSIADIIIVIGEDSKNTETF